MKKNYVVKSRDLFDIIELLLGANLKRGIDFNVVRKNQFWISENQFHSTAVKEILLKYHLIVNKHKGDSYLNPPSFLK